MVQDAHVRRMQAEKLLKEANSKVCIHIINEYVKKEKKS